ncbi:MAG TPA: hypothetical protein EYP34_12510 [Chromatiaceae bacterium]|nr:hypothetical protein [Chromatiaceae bacterium]
MKLSYGKLNKYVFAAVLATGLAGCSDTDKAEQAAVEEAVAKFDLLSLVPADTPYVAASSREMPLGLSEKVLQASGFGINDGSLRKELADMDADASDTEQSFTKLLDALLAELEGKMSAKGLESLGVPINGRSLIYGLGILPVVWAEILDAEKVEALLSRVEERSGMKAETATHGEVNYRRFLMDDLVGILAVYDKHLIMAVLPVKSEVEMLPLVFGETKPTTSLAGGQFKEFTAKRKFLGYGDGYVDLVRFAEMALGESQGINADVLNALGISSSDLSPACRSFVKTTIQSVPLISFGFTDVTDSGYAIKAMVETSPGVAGWLQKMASPVPGVGVANEGLLSFGAGFNLPQIRDGVKAMLRNFAETGKGCELVDEEGLAQAMQGIDMMLNPMLAGIKGFNVTINDIEMDVQTMSPKSLDAQLLLAAADPKGMFSMLGMFNPQLAQLDIPADGTPVKVPLETMSPMAPPTYAAIKGEALALKLGEAAPKGIDDVLSAPMAKVPPIFAMNYNAGKLFDVVGPPMKSMMESMQGEEAEDLKSAYDSMESAASIYGNIDFRMLGTDKGMEFDTVIDLK